MKNYFTRFITVLFFVLALACSGHATTYTFNAPSGQWNVASNWMPNGVPGAGDDVVIQANSIMPELAYLVLTSNVSVHNLSINNADENFIVSGNFDISVAGTLDCSQGDAVFSGTGTITVAGLTKFAIDYCSPCVTKLDGKTLIMNGGGSLGAYGTIAFLSNAMLINPVGATFNITAASEYPFTRIGASSYLSGTFENLGNINHTGTPGDRTIIYIPFNNSSTVNVNSGSEMIINAGGTEQNATINLNNSNSVFSFSQSGNNIINNSTFTGAGWLASNILSLTMPAGNTVNCKLKIAGTPSGSAFIDHLGISPTELYISGAYTRAVSTTMNTGNATIFGGACTGDFDANISGTITFNTGTITGTGTFTVAGKTTNTLGITLDKKILIMNGGCDLNSGFILNNSAILRNPAGATLTVVTTLGAGFNGSGGTFENFGTINKNTIGDFNIWCTFINNGTVNFTAGYISMFGGSHNGATVNIGNGLVYNFGTAAHTLNNSSFLGATGWLSNSSAAPLTINSGNTITCNYQQSGGTTIDNLGISPPVFNQTGGIYNRTVSTPMSTGNATISGGGTCSGDFDAAISGTLDYNGTISGLGTFTVAGTTTTTGSAVILDKKTLIMNGGCNLNNQIDLNNNAILRNPPGATLTVGNNTSPTLLSGGTFESQGVINKNFPGLFSIQCVFANTGTVNFSMGSMTMAGGFHNGATVNIANGLVYNFGFSAAHTLSNSSFLGAAGWLGTTNAAPLTINSGNTVSCGYQQTGGTTTDNMGISPTAFNQTGGTYNRTVSTPMNTGITAIWGTCNGDFDAAISGPLDFKGTISGLGTFTVAGKTTVSGGSTLDKKTLIMNGGCDLNSGITLNNNALLRNPSAATLTVGSNGTLSGAGGTFENQGVINKNSSGTFSIQCFFANTGTVNFNMGAMTMAGGFHNGATVNIANGLVYNFGFSAAHTLSNSSFLGAAGWLGTTNAAPLTINLGNTVSCGYLQSGGTTTDNMGISPTAFDQTGGTYNRTVSTPMNTGVTTIGGTCNGDFDAAISGTLTYKGVVSGLGTFTVAGTTTVSGTSTLDKKTLIMTGGCDLNAGITLTNNALLRNPSAATLTVGSSGNVSGAGGTFENQGVINKNSSGTFSIQCFFANTGTVNFNMGAMTMAGGFHNGATVNIANGLVYNFGFSAAHILSNSSFLGAAGWLGTTNAAPLTINLGNTVSCGYLQSGGTTTDNMGISPPVFNQTGGTYNRTVSTPMNTGIAGTTIIYGTCNGDFDAAISGTLDYKGTISGLGTFTVTGKTTVSGAAVILDKKTLIMTGGCDLNNGINLNNNAIFRNAPGSTLIPANGAIIQDGGTFDNQGILNKNTAGQSSIWCLFDNSGTVSIASGSLSISGTTFTNSGIVKGIGTISVNANTVVTNTGTYAPGLSPGTLSFTGTYTNSILDFEIQESGGTVTKDLLPVTGNMTLNGTLNLIHLGGNIPAGTYDIVTCTGTRTGTFSTINYPPQCNGNCSVAYTATKAQLVLSSPLPIELLQFTAKPLHHSNHLAWVTATETNNKAFDIERSGDGRDWQTIGEVAGHGNSNTQQQYEYEDLHPLDDLQYYRLKQVDFDEAFTYSPIVSVQRSPSKILTASPNPTSGVITLQWTDALDAETPVTVVNSLGQVVRTMAVPEKTTTMFLDMSDLPAGTYYLRVGAYGATVLRR